MRLSEVGWVDRSSAQATVANRTDEHTIAEIAALRRLRLTGSEIAEVLDRPLSTVSGILTRIGMGRLGRIGLQPLSALSAPSPVSWPTSTSRGSGHHRMIERHYGRSSPASAPASPRRA